MMSRGYDYVLVGGGLQNLLILMALSVRRPQTRLLLVECAPEICGNHTWCHHPRDVPPGAEAFIAPLVAHRWNRYAVHFPEGRRDLPIAYAAITSERAREVALGVFDAFAAFECALGVAAEHVERDRVTLDNGRSVRARAVIDARGPARTVTDRAEGYQKFLGQELELSSGHGLAAPVLMDATVAQSDGFRFFYVLPLSPTRLLVEDTMFSDTSMLDVERARNAIDGYARSHGWRVARLVREERGILPMPWRETDTHLGPPGPGEPLRAGYGGGFFHPATGYSFPVAARLADRVSRLEPDELFSGGLASMYRDLRRRQRFARYLNHMLFQWFEPENRRHVFERFYRLPPDTIERFYALRMNAADRARMFMGRPPRGISWRSIPMSLLSRRGTP